LARHSLACVWFNLWHCQVRYIAPVFPWNDPKFARPPVSSLDVPKASTCAIRMHGFLRLAYPYICCMWHLVPKYF
jgi:hypothetical protein